MQSSRNVLRLLPVAVATTMFAVMAAPAMAFVAYENLPTNDSLKPSFHNATGPILADDFMSATGGPVTLVEWWGTAAQSTSWELLFHTNAPTNQPNIDNVMSGGLFKHLVNAAPGAQVMPGIFHYSVALSNSLVIAPNTTYWFSVANFQPGWNWADALNGPTVGSELFNAHQSVSGQGLCSDGGPHCGPWTDVHTDLAFRVNAVPEPGTYLLMATGLLGLAGWARRGRASHRD